MDKASVDVLDYANALGNDVTVRLIDTTIKSRVKKTEDGRFHLIDLDKIVSGSEIIQVRHVKVGFY